MGDLMELEHPRLRADPPVGTMPPASGSRWPKAPAVKKAAAESEKPVEHPASAKRGRYHQKGREPLPDGTTLYLCAGGQPELRQDDPLQPAHRLQPARRQFPGCDGWTARAAIRNNLNTEVTDLARHLLHVALYQRGDRDPAVHHRREAHGHHQYRGRHQHREESVLTMQLTELDTLMVLALNMMDEMRGNGGTVRINKMEAMLGIPVVPISAAKNEGGRAGGSCAPCRKVSGAAGPDGFLRRGGSRRRSPPLHPRHHPPDRGSCQGRRASRCALRPQSSWRATSASRRP